MKKMHRVLALILAAVLCMGAFAVTASAEEIDRETFEQALLETAFAYYYKGAPIQYDSTTWTIQNRNDWGAPCRLTAEVPPEYGNSDFTVFSVCSDWIYNVYYNAFGYRLMSFPRNCLTKRMTALKTSNPLVVYKYDPTGEDAGAMKNLDTALKTARAGLQFGDIIVSYGESGHTVMYIGDYKGDGHEYVMHCWGEKFDGKTGQDKIETRFKDGSNNPEGGAIRINDIDAAIFCAENAEGAVWSLRSEKHVSEGFVVLRPYGTEAFSKCALTEAAKTRLKYRGIELNRETSVSRYASVEKGDEITVTITITNNGTEPFMGVTVTEPLPHGATVKDNGGAAQSGTALTWTRDIAVGASVNFEYTVTATATRGGFVTFPSTNVGGLTTRETKIPVSGKKLNAAGLEKFQDLTDGFLEVDPEKYATVSETDPIQFANAIYSDLLGINLDLPLDLNEWTANLMEQVPVGGVSQSKYQGWMWQPKASVTDAKWARVADMIIPEHVTGYAVYLENSPDEPRDDWSAVNRVQEYKATSYEPGDIFIGLNDPDVQTVRDPANVLVFVYLGHGQAAYYDEMTGVSYADFTETVSLFLSKNIIFGLRPTLAYDDINTGKMGSKTPFADVKNTDWFYTYVKDLYHDGTVNGMNATTYAPKGTLTYGQALKLIVCALGYGEQAKTGTHWASGYLAFAKEKGWISSDFSAENLDAWITRLTFCQIAAKAKSLTEQPENNPFEDTDDTAVLALNKAGVINGMTETTFEPTGILTRAQIAKIIWILRDL